MNQFIETIVQMYKLNNLTPIKGKYLAKDSKDNLSCCGLTAFVFSKPQFKQALIKLIKEETGEDGDNFNLNCDSFDVICSLFKNAVARQGFIQGFDGGCIYTKCLDYYQKKTYHTWHKLGTECRERVMEELNVDL